MGFTVESKKWWQSKTLWLNAIVLAIAIGAALVDSAILPAKAVAVLTGIVLPVLNMALRVVSGQPLDVPGAPKPPAA